MMGYKESYEAYINLSRKELQGLCKKHNLPANKCQSDLAKSLASHFKKKNSSIVRTGEASCSPAKEKSQEKMNEKDHDKNENQHEKRLDAEVGNDLRATGPILIESSEQKTYSSIVSTGEASSGPAEEKSQEKTYEKDHDGNENQHEKRLDADVGNDLRTASPILIESSEEGINIEETIDGIIDNLYSTSGDVLRDQDLVSQSPTKRQEQAPPLEHSSNNINLKSQSPTKSQNQDPPPKCTCDDKSTDGLVLESSTVTETAARSASSFEFFVTSEEGINLFIDLNSGPSDWVESLKDEINMKPGNQSGSISSFVKGTNSSLSSVLGENFQSETAPIESYHNLLDVPTQIEKKLGGILEEGEENGEMEFSEILNRGSKEVHENSVSGPNLLVLCQNSDKLAEEEPDPLTEELTVFGPADKVVVLDSATGDSQLSSSDALGDLSVPKARDSLKSTVDKNLKRVLKRVSEESSQNKKHHVVEESNKSRRFTRILRSSRALVKESQQINVSVLPRRSTRKVSKQPMYT